MMRTSVFLVTAILASSVAVAQPTQQGAAATTSATAPKALDPNEMVCEREQEPGSRLASAKVCHTRAEWADLKRQDRQDVDRAQTQRGAMAPH